VTVEKETLEERIKKHEGYVGHTYTDTLGFLTGGYGHKIIAGEEIPTDMEGWEKLFQKDLRLAKEGAKRLITKNKVKDLPCIPEEIIIEMVYQMGETGVSKFKKMFKALKEEPKNYREAADQMMDSRWAKQTYSRARNLSDKMRKTDAA
jgi:lysozyme|tara:strand:- start:1834 stop:2280 length:447 start_codon:yes stop_codon:yes gene_type:complete